jgi:hypothetical protein
MSHPPALDPLVVLASELSARTDLDEVAETILREGSAIARADRCVLALPSESGRRLDLMEVGGGGVSRTPFEVTSLGDDSPLSTAVRTGRPVVIGAGAESGDPIPLPDGRHARTLAAFPLDTALGTSGSIVFAWLRSRRLGAEELDVLTELARWAGLALERAWYRRREWRLVEAIRGDLLGPLDAGPHLDAVGAYRAPWSGVPTGGDWHDAFVLENGTVVLVIGDVVGHGIAATPDMLTFRAFVRAFMFENPDPAVCLQRLDRACAVFEPASGIATVLVATYDPATRLLTWVNGGIPSPLVQRGGGPVTPLRSGRAPLVGTGRRRPMEAEDAVELTSGDLLVLFTDGLLLPSEAGGTDLDAIVSAVAAHHDAPLQSLVETLTSLGTHGRFRTDDASVLAVRVR